MPTLGPGDACMVTRDVGICHLMGPNERPELDELVEEVRQVLSDAEARPEVRAYERSAGDPAAWSVRPPGGFDALRRSLFHGHQRDEPSRKDCSSD